MLQDLQAKLRPIRVRQRRDRALRWGTAGLIAGALVGSGCYLAEWLGATAPVGAGLLVLVACGMASAIAGASWPTSWRSSARLVDRVYGLKDRTVTALDFAARAGRDPVQALQINDAMQHLSQIEAARVVPWKAPRLVPLAVVALGLMLVLGLLPLSPETSVANVPAETARGGP